MLNPNPRFSLECIDKFDDFLKCYEISPDDDQVQLLKMAWNSAVKAVFTNCRVEDAISSPNPESHFLVK